MRIRPAIGIMEIEEEFEVKIVGAPGEGDGVFEIVGKIRRRMKKTEANPIITVVLENLQRGFRIGAVLENGALLLGLRQKRQIGADRVIRRKNISNTERKNEREKDGGWDFQWRKKYASRPDDFKPHICEAFGATFAEQVLGAPIGSGVAEGLAPKFGFGIMLWTVRASLAQW